MVVYIPTFSELIEACGDKLKGLFSPQVGGSWWAIEEIGLISTNSLGTKTFSDFRFWAGSTPEEAVANLWLALNKKK